MDQCAAVLTATANACWTNCGATSSASVPAVDHTQDTAGELCHFPTIVQEARRSFLVRNGRGIQCASRTACTSWPVAPP
jgi:(1->4)-alpha-D-glucan 1-alpha-D-glucosylmutase